MLLAFVNLDKRNALAGHYAKAAKELHKEVADGNADFEKVYDSLTKFSNNGCPWFQVAEIGHDNFMARASQS